MRTPPKRKLMVLFTALALALVTAIPSGAAPDGATADAGPAPEVAKGKYNSYVVVMKAEPLIATEGQDQLDTARARNRGQQMKAEHAKVMRNAGVSTDKIAVEYVNALNGFAARVGHAEAVKLAAQPEVAVVLPDVLLQPDTDSSPGFIGLNTGTGGGAPTGATGKGVVVGVIDSGIWPENPSFADNGMPAPPIDTSGIPCEFGNTAHNPDDAPFACNNKLIGARQVLPTYRALVGAEDFEFDSARDDNGHGSHTAGTAAGNRNVPATVLGHDLGPISGIAPDAHIIAYKGLGTLGGFGSDLALAIDTAVADGVDVINYSIGGSGTTIGADEIAFLYAADAGVFVATSAGNSGPGAGTVFNPAKVPWLTTVGANTQARYISGKIELGNGVIYEGASVTQGVDWAPIVDAADAGDELCNPGALNEDLVAGAIVLCKRGVIARVAKSQAVLQAGGVGMIMYEASDAGNHYTDTHLVPSVHIDNTPGLEIKAYIAAEGDSATARIFDTGVKSVWPYAPSMTDFSSRGPNVYGDIIKPDITAPGLQILAPYSPAAADGEMFAAIAGTSMASPHVAGLFALMKEAHPDWSPEAARSALMTTADTDVLDNNRTTKATPFGQGSGMVDPGRVVQKGSMFQPGLVYEAGFNDYLAFLCDASPANIGAATCAALAAAGFEMEAHNLNYPSIGVSEVPGQITVKRTVTSVAQDNGNRTFKPTIVAPPGYTVSVSPSSLTLKRGQSATFEVTITNVGAPVGQWRFGSLTWADNTGDYQVHSPIAVRGVPLAAPAAVNVDGADGTGEVDLRIGYTGPFAAQAVGLAAVSVDPGTVTQDAPDDDFSGCTLPLGPGETEHAFTLSGSAYLRIALGADDLSGPADTDLDLYLCRGTTLVASSGSPATNELINMAFPADGDYRLIVHGWLVPGGTVDYGLRMWDVSPTAAGGTLQIDSAPATVTAGTTETIGFSWSGAAGTELGVLTYGDGASRLGFTLVTVNG